jgi:hypothetical protein
MSESNVEHEMLFSLRELVSIIDMMAERSGFFYGIGPVQISEIISENTEAPADQVEKLIRDGKLSLHP